MKKILFISASVFFSTMVVAQLGTIQTLPVDAQILDFNKYTSITGYNGTYSTFNNTENTKGKRYLFDDWAKGSCVTSDNKFFQSDSIYFNLDKIQNTLIATNDKVHITSVNKENIKSFMLRDSDKTYTFEKVDAIKPNVYFIALAKSQNNYCLYKFVKTTFEKENYSTDGLMETGHPYDEYVDAFQYYILLPGGKEYREIFLKSKSIKEVLNRDKEKVNSYFTQHSAELSNEEFLTGLINFINQ